MVKNAEVDTYRRHWPLGTARSVAMSHSSKHALSSVASNWPELFLEAVLRVSVPRRAKKRFVQAPWLHPSCTVVHTRQVLKLGSSERSRADGTWTPVEPLEVAQKMATVSRSYGEEDALRD